MKKLDWKKVLLILLPVLSIGLATTMDSVMVFDSVSGITEYYSYFGLIPNSDFAILMPLAAILSAVCGILAAILIVKKKSKLLKGIGACAFCATTFAVLPILLKGDVIVFPNVGLPIFMMVDCLVAYTMMKNPQPEQKAEPKRLKAR